MQLSLFFSIFIVLLLGVILWRIQKKKQQNNLILNRIETSDLEKNRIGKEIHDGIATKLLSLTYLFKSKNVKNSLLELYYELRQLSHQLHPHISSNTSIEELIADILPDIDKITFEVNVQPENIILPEPYNIHFYRILQELITNSFKHSTADIISIRVTKNKKNIDCLYLDNGHGDSGKKHGHGLRNIFERIRTMKGTVFNNTKKKHSGYALHFCFEP